jgi:hypothetical protein
VSDAQQYGLDQGGGGDRYDPNGDGRLQERFVEQWRTNAYGCVARGCRRRRP